MTVNKIVYVFAKDLGVKLLKLADYNDDKVIDLGSKAEALDIEAVKARRIAAKIEALLSE